MPSDYTYAENSWGKSFHKIYPAKKYSAAKDQCKSDRSFLAIPRSEAENDFIASLIPNENIWIGINDIDNEGSFVADDGREISWMKWDSGEPNNAQHGEDVVEIKQDNPNQNISESWNDVNVFQYSRKFVCLLHI